MTYDSINSTFEDRIWTRLDKTLRHNSKTNGSVYEVGLTDELLSLVIELAKESNNDKVNRWWVNKRYEEDGPPHADLICVINGKPHSLWEADLIFIADCRNIFCAEISILRTIYEMESSQADCAAIVAKATEMLSHYDEQKSSHA